MKQSEQPARVLQQHQRAASIAGGEGKLGTWLNHGLVESAIRDIKMTASAIHLEQPTLNPQLSLMLACAAFNSTEYTKGYSSFQWCYGKDYVITDEDDRTFRTLPEMDKSICLMKLW